MFVGVNKFLYLCGVKFEMEHEDIKLQQLVGEIPCSKLHQAGGEFPAPMQANGRVCYSLWRWL